ncbi:2-oxoglutarate dehydrogenase E1 component [Vulgatibacter incomptus]|uniref:2-oxoglutarate dehydrogenase E1 component n=1 Tax=Vulgatibacter incomptus TaxID=1391653 RepID=A0A0K1P9Q2_9BACT|nr:2-oxoglutarate dehydrogenase E1 component [Vulgatibacter incomptus]AKU90258.1 2-oxoglutarate dehydrogenase E1 component [Vulgatibacter incomptus]
MAIGSQPLPSNNLPFIEELYARFLEDESSVDEAWRNYFRGLGDRTPPTGPAFAPRSIFAPRAMNGAPASEHEKRLAREAAQDRVGQLVQRYRQQGHVFAHLNPLQPAPSSPVSHFELSEFGLDESSLDKTFTAGGLRGTLRELIAHLEETYCRTIGVELAHIEDPEVRDWLQTRMESTQNHVALDRSQQIKLLTDLTDAEIFEQFLHTSFVGAKRFSLEGGESLIPMVQLVIERAASHDVEEVVIGMAHRGRLNVMANVMGMPPREIFAEFADEDPNLYIGRGDVKYHLGYSNDRDVDGKKVHLSLSFNPSHLEFVDAVVAGRVRSKQDRRKDLERRKVLPLLIHGDAAFAGQGIIAELFNMADLPGYTVGGTVHVVVNNQVGFTTDPRDARSTRYATDVAKMLQIPIFHVNGEDPESVVQVVQLATDFRARYGKDVVIDLWCYRKHGHNEGDEPTFTQPEMYRKIHEHPSIREQFVKKLESLGQVTPEQAEEIAAARRKVLDEQLAEQRSGHKRKRPSAMAGLWAKYAGGFERDTADISTGVALPVLQDLAAKLTMLPPGFTAHPKIVRFLEQRREMGEGKRPLDWGMGEALAFATLVDGGTRIRLSGQDCERGTFSHRHSVLHDYTSGGTYTPLNNLREGQADYEVRNSPLSEVSVLGYEYGYSLDTPDGLTIWEAQFGDFVNAAQVIIDQFIASGEDKWHRLSGVTLLLPHAFEGQGPEHSSARIARWLSLSADDNMQVCNATTPAQFFHLLRRQVLRPFRKPLVVFSPKSLLRNPEAVSSLEELATGEFQRVIDDSLFAAGGEGDASKVRRVLLCTGKVYYELLAERRDKKREDVAIVRIEQLYPNPIAEIERTLGRYPNMAELVWVQEEPANHGAWLHMWNALVNSGILRVPLAQVTRPAAASPATGSNASHKLEQRRIIETAFAPIQFSSR